MFMDVSKLIKAAQLIQNLSPELAQEILKTAQDLSLGQGDGNLGNTQPPMQQPEGDMPARNPNIKDFSNNKIVF